MAPLIIAGVAILGSLIGVWIEGRFSRPGQGQGKVSLNPDDPHNLKWEDPLQEVLQRFK